MSIKEIISRLEAASKGSDELDACVIAEFVGGTVEMSPFNGRWCVYQGTDRNGRPRSWEPKTAIERELYGAHAHDRGPTRSLDAALTLVPEGATFHVMNDCGLPGRAKIGPIGASIYLTEDAPKFIQADGDTPALALCIAALKARS